ncbi:hypothetical protein [Nocardioides sp. AX2bis]|uniref:hypothetical protein n=1 Tax=Nocardioides sp. AX2bis TaxID=2653157 RepID=UPI0012F30AA5|nr:hypothetical protein [Nocardioides sp. AX2bis]VXC53547.1 exported hypothetical protein [Nocardioides sp. AX2bis]
MKKIFAAIITAFLMSAGLVATASSPASAAPCTYPDTCFETSTSATGLTSKAPKKAKLFVKVSSFGNGRPDGRLTFTFVRANGNSMTFSRAYPSDNKKYNFKGLRKGKYTVVVNFVPADGSQYLGSGDTTKVKVKGAKRRG